MSDKEADRIVAGVDIGSGHDRTAIVVINATEGKVLAAVTVENVIAAGVKLAELKKEYNYSAVGVDDCIFHRPIVENWRLNGWGIIAVKLTTRLDFEVTRDLKQAIESGDLEIHGVNTAHECVFDAMAMAWRVRYDFGIHFV